MCLRLQSNPLQKLTTRLEAAFCCFWVFERKFFLNLTRIYALKKKTWEIQKPSMNKQENITHNPWELCGGGVGRSYIIEVILDIIYLAVSTYNHSVFSCVIINTS